MNDISTILRTIDALNTPDTITEAPTPPSKFVPTHFHKSNLFGAKTKLMWHNGKYWLMRAPNNGGDNNGIAKKEIQQWFPGPAGYSRHAMNPGSVDGEYIDGKAKEWPEGYEHEQWLADKKANGGAPQTSAEPAAPAQAAQAAPAAPANDGKLKLADGRTFYRDQSSQLELNKHAAKLVRRLDELLAKMNESIPNSLKGYLSESDRGPLLLEALNPAETAELQSIYKDLKAIADFKDDQGPLISDKNVSLLNSKLARVKPAIDAAGPGKASDKATDKATDKKPTAGSLAKFAKSGKGGLANDPDETAAINELQTYLNDLGFDTGTPDGKYGPATKKGVKAFQKYFGAKEDGDAGPETIGQIIKLRSFMFKGGKKFADFRKDMARMEELIAKGGKTKSSESTSFRDLINIVEQSLTEALSDQEKKELTDLIAQYDDVMSDAEFAAAMPKVSYDRYKKIIDDAKKLDQTGDGVPELDKYAKPDGSVDWAKVEKDLGPTQFGTVNGTGVENPNQTGDGVPELDKYAKPDGSVDWAKVEKDLGPTQFGTVNGTGVENPNFKDTTAAADDPDELDDKPDDKPDELDDKPDEKKEPVNLDVASVVDKVKALHDGIDGLGTDEESVLAVLGSIDGSDEWFAIKDAFKKLYDNELVDWLQSDTAFGEEDQIMAIVNRLEKKERTGELDDTEFKSADDAAAALNDAIDGMGTDEQSLLAVLGKVSTRLFPAVVKSYEQYSDEHLLADVAQEMDSWFGTKDFDRANDIVKRFGYELLTDEPYYKKLDGAGDVETGDDETDVTDTGGTDTKPKVMTIDDINKIDPSTAEGAEEFLNAVINNPEVLGQLDAETQKAIKDAMGK